MEKLDGRELETIKAIFDHASAAGITRLYARSDPLPRMGKWLDKLGEHYSQPALNVAQEGG